MSTDIVQRNAAQDLITDVRSDVFKEQLSLVLPPALSPEKFVRIATTAVMTNPELPKLERASVLRAMVQAAADGLMPDGKQAAIVGRGGKAVYTPMISGFRSILADFGWTLKTKTVYAADTFEWTDEPPSRRHEQARSGVDRGDIVGAYAIVTHRDGRELQMFMPWVDIAKRREVAATKQVWDRWPAEMAEKTVGKAIFADVPLAEADRERILRILEASQTDPVEASRMIYGPPRTETAGGLPAAVDHQDDRATADPPSPAERVAVDEGQQAAAAAAPPRAAAVPGSEPEPSLAEEPQFNAPAGADDDPVVAAGREAAKFTIPRGDHKGLSLADAHAKGPTGVRWLRWAISNIAEPDEYRRAVWAFCRVYEPELYQEALAKQEAAA